MSKVSIELSTLTNIGDAIREKKGTTEEIAVTELGNEIRGIESGGGDAELENKLFTLEGDCTYKFAYGSWDWLINEYGDRIKSGTITTLDHCFYYSALSEIPFDLTVTSDFTNNQTNGGVLAYIFGQSNIKKAPYIRATILSNGKSQIFMNYMFSGCKKLTEIPHDFFDVLFNGVPKDELPIYRINCMLQDCVLIRKLPNLSLFHDKEIVASYSLYMNGFSGCYSLEEATDLPIMNPSTDSNMFINSPFKDCYRLKKATFKTNDDGTPLVANWKSQTIGLYDYTGYAESKNNMTGIGYEVGKQVTNAETYQALKNDPDWWTMSYKYSRYNHDSAVETINSLPDTSAYLAENGGTNTIKFKGQSGELTDGGAINTLTEEEIAVATAKGWTVTLS